MKTKHYIQLSSLAFYIMVSSACNVARISKGSTVYQWINKGGAGVDELYKLEPDKEIRATITENSDYIIVKPELPDGEDFGQGTLIKNESLPAGWRTENTGSLYYPETKHDPTAEDAHFRYSELKHGIQAMSILLKFRGNIPQDAVPRIPPQVETGTSFGLAYGFKHSWNSYDANKNVWGKHVSNFSITAGPMIGGAATDLKAASNAPGLNGDRKSALISYGGFVMLGTGPLNIGYALGADRVLGYGASKWVYNGKIWHGVIVGLNIITF